MKKLSILVLALLTYGIMQAQWVNDPVNNTFIANTSYDAGEVYLTTNAETGDTYVQWMQFHSNNWSPTLQRLNAAGEPQWGPDGIHITGHEFSSMSEGVAIATTTDGGVVSCFSAYDGYSYAVKLNADGTYAWGEEGVQLFNGLGFSRTECIAGNDGGVWTLGFDYSKLYAQYVNADGTLNPNITISASGQACMFGQLTLGNDNNVFVTYEKTSGGMYTEKEICVAGYAVDGTQVSPETPLMSNSGAFQSTYWHQAISDGMGGGYVYIWHPGLNDAFNTYVFHFNQNGASTILDPHGAAVHTPDPDYFYGYAYGTVDPVTHNIIVAYEETDAETQTLSAVYVNCVTPTGDVLWGDGKLVINNGTAPCNDIRVDAYEYGDGFMVTYLKRDGNWSENSTIEAKGYDIKGELQWETTMSSTSNWKVAAENTPGFREGQNMVMWVSHDNGGLYGQNIGWNGTMGEIVPPIPPAPCDAPTNFQGEAYYNTATGSSAAVLSWTAPETQPLHYNLYCEGLKEIIEIDGQYDSYYTERDPGDYVFKLTAVYEDCESNFALTPDGEDYILLEIPNFQSVTEDADEAIVTITKIYTMTGQLVKETNLENLPSGIYLIQGFAQNGKLVTRKLVNSKR